jgi:hypothetical protein
MSRDNAQQCRVFFPPGDKEKAQGLKTTWLVFYGPTKELAEKLPVG